MRTIKLVNWSYEVPLSVHFLVTSRCNLDCERCFYRREPGEVPLPRALELVNEWAEAGVKSLAIGGGEPMLYRGIGELVTRAKAHGMYVGVTTNGTILREWKTPPNRVHISWDEIHPTSRRTVEWALSHYREQADKVGVNHIVTSIRGVQEALGFDADNVTLILEKPYTRFHGWRELVDLMETDRDRVWLDACLASYLNQLGLTSFPVPCRQGETAMCVTSNLQAKRCSNLNRGVRYTSLKGVWESVRTDDDCILKL